MAQRGPVTEAGADFSKISSFSRAPAPSSGLDAPHAILYVPMTKLLLQE